VSVLNSTEARARLKGQLFDHNRNSQIQASVDVLNDDYASSGLRFALTGTDRTVNADWFDNVSFGT
jgi:hypothetical protein